MRVHDAGVKMDWFDWDVVETMLPQWNYNHISDSRAIFETRERGAY